MCADWQSKAGPLVEVLWEHDTWSSAQTSDADLRADDLSRIPGLTSSPAESVECGALSFGRFHPKDTSDVST
jgi:hypothetical protein